MSLYLDPGEPTDVEPEDRIDEIASIFARGILRLRGRIRVDIPPPQNLEESSPTCLELSAPSRPEGWSLTPSTAWAATPRCRGACGRWPTASSASFG